MAKKQTRGRSGGGKRGGAAPRAASAGSGSNRLFYLILLLVVVGGGAWLLLARGGGGDETSAEPLAAAQDAVADPNSGIALGPEDSPATIMEFFDYSCPHCANFGGFTGRLIRQNYVEGGGPARWIMYDYVLGSFPNSLETAIAGRCAGEQGRYWEMHDLLLGQQTTWYTQENPTGTIRDIAGMVGLDGRAFRDCMDERRHVESIMASRKYGEQLGVNSTPVLFFNGRRIGDDETSYEGLERLIRAAVDSAAAASAAGTAEEDGTG